MRHILIKAEAQDKEGSAKARQRAEAVREEAAKGKDFAKGARGVLVNITANDSLTLDEYYEVMSTIQSFTADEATVIVGTAFDEAMGDSLRVTMVATGLGNPVAGRQAKPQMTVLQGTGTDGMPLPSFEGDAETPAIWRSRRGSSAALDAAQEQGIDTLDIPAFLRKQAD